MNIWKNKNFKEMRESQSKIDNLKFDLYDKMNIRNIFEIIQILIEIQVLL